MGHRFLIWVLLAPFFRSNILFGVFLAYFGSYVHRPRMMALSSLIALLGCVIMFLPHYLAAPYQYDGQIIVEGEDKSK